MGKPVVAEAAMLFILTHFFDTLGTLFQITNVPCFKKESKFCRTDLGTNVTVLTVDAASHPRAHSVSIHEKALTNTANNLQSSA